MNKIIKHDEQRVMLGIISYCPTDPVIREARLKLHRMQLDWLETFLVDVPHLIYRVEQCYDDEFTMVLSSDKLRIISMSFDSQLGPSMARNRLLEALYIFKYDWMIYMDDDRVLYPHYGAEQFLTECEFNPAMHKLAEQGTLITGVCPAMKPFKKANADFNKLYPISDYWNLVKGQLDGFLQIALIPNLNKFGKELVWFDEDIDLAALKSGSIQEDVKFELDWCQAGYPAAINQMMIVKDSQITDLSTIYADKNEREQLEGLGRSKTTEYIKTLTHGRCSTVAEFNRRRNNFEKQAVKRLHEYTVVDSDLKGRL